MIPEVQFHLPSVTSIKVMLRLNLHPQTATLAPGPLATTMHLPALFRPALLMRKPYLTDTQAPSWIHSS